MTTSYEEHLANRPMRPLPRVPGIKGFADRFVLNGPHGTPKTNPEYWAKKGEEWQAHLRKVMPKYEKEWEMAAKKRTLDFTDKPKDAPLETGSDPANLYHAAGNTEELDRMVFEPLEWIVPDLVPEGVGLLVGPPKLGKSWIALDIAMSAATGKPALTAAEVEGQRPVLFFALEDSERRLQARLRAIGGVPRTRDFMYHTSLRAEEIHQLIPYWLQRHGADKPLIVLDVLAKAMRPLQKGETQYIGEYNQMSALAAAVKAYPGASLLAVHHTRKAPDADWMNSTSGTQAINGAVDFTIGLRGDRGSSQAQLLGTGRDMPDYDLALNRRVAGGWELAGDSIGDAADEAWARRERAGLKPESEASQVLGLLQSRNEPLGADDLADELGIDVKKVRVYLSRLVKSERARSTSRGRYVAL